MYQPTVRRVVGALFAVALFGSLANCGQVRPATTTAYVRVPASVLTPEFVKTTGFNRDHVRDEDFAFGYIGRSALAALPESLAGEAIELDSAAWARQRHDPKTLAPVSDPDEKSATAFDARIPAEPYHDYAALTAELERLAADYPALVTLSSAGRSVQGRDLWIATVSDADEEVEGSGGAGSIDGAASASEPKLLYVANMHGDEVVGREMMIYLLRHLLTEYGRDPRITRLVDTTQIFIMPSMNPDGFELGQRANARGVDLNRDFPDFTSDPTDTPQGRAAETQAVMALHARHHFVAALNFHGGDVCFNMPWDTRSNARAQDRFGDDLLMKQVGRRYADANATMRANSGGSFDRGLTYGYEWYQIDGGMQDWSIQYRSSFHATVELSAVKWPAESSLPRYWEENREALLAYLEDATFGVHLRVVDGQGRPVSQPSVRVASLARSVTYPSHFVSRLALPGSQSVQVSAPGFATTTITATPTQLNGQYQDVVLTP